MLEPGLYVVSTPIGNLEDITFRALRILKEVDFIACEDTRHTGQLLHHYQISARLISFHEHNKLQRTPELLEMLRQGKRLALTADAGTPGISDPGFYLIRAAIQRGYRVHPIPGASALLSALVVAGLPIDHFVFEGFLPKREGRRLKRLRDLVEQERTLVFFESPHRIGRTLRRFQEVFGDRPMVLARELTKKFEEVLRGRISEIAAQVEQRELRGEMVLIVSGIDGESTDSADSNLPESARPEQSLASRES